MRGFFLNYLKQLHMKLTQVRHLIKQEVRSVLRENITAQSSPQEFLDYGNDIRAKLQAKIEDGMKAVRLQIKLKKTYQGNPFTINGQQVRPMPVDELQLFRVNFPKVKEMIIEHKKLPGVINGILYYMSKGDQANVERIYNVLMKTVSRQGL